MEEKQNLLNKIFKYQLEGYKFCKCFTLDDNIEEMKYHLAIVEQIRNKEIERYKITREQTEIFVKIYNELHKNEISHITDDDEKEAVGKVIGVIFKCFDVMCEKLK